MGFPGGSAVKESACSAGDTRDASLIPGSGRSPGEGNGNPLQYFCLKNSMDRGAWWATVLEVSKSQVWLSTHTGARLFTVVCGCHISKAEFSSCIRDWMVCSTSSIYSLALDRKKCTSVPGQGKGLKSQYFLKFCTLATTLG